MTISPVSKVHTVPMMYENAHVPMIIPKITYLPPPRRRPSFHRMHGSTRRRFHCVNNVQAQSVGCGHGTHSRSSALLGCMAIEP